VSLSPAEGSFVSPIYSEFQMSAIQELGNIGTGSAATALSQMVGHPTDIDPPAVDFVPIAEAAERVGPLEQEVFAVLTPVVGDVPAAILLVFPGEAASALCGMLGCDWRDEMGQSALQEIGNILTASYSTALQQMTGLAIEPAPPQTAFDMLGSVVDSIIASSAIDSDTVLFLQTALRIESTACDFGFLFVPEQGAINGMLAALGLDEEDQ
jgi:chemotaxis protein CheC